MSAAVTTAPRPAAATTTSTATGPVLAVATAATGLMSGLFFAFDVSVMPGLAAGDDRTYVTAMQHINTAITNPAFGAVFLGALAVPAVGTWLLQRTGQRAAALWTAVATLLYVAALIVTAAVNIPLNDQLARAGDPAGIADLAAVRAAFESTWTTANIARTVLCTAALVALTRALLLHRRTPAAR
ncbi:anthrone oxygenase family protein [Kitasatospora sp. NPDC093806]|uniref:anthrone oxygenase family protein n=1 Tax=Kitasatospora sp. NPDC093806 TaxID=3155075 RepID=UPI003442AC93